MTTTPTAAMLALLAGCSVSPSLALAQPQSKPAQGTSLTIYSSAQPGAIPASMYRPVPGQNNYAGGYGGTPNIPGYAVVRADRTLTLATKHQTIKFDDVAAYIDPTTVSFASLTDPMGTSVLEQSYQFDLVSGAKLLERFLDQTINVTTVRGDKTEVVTGKLLSANGGQLVLAGTEGAPIRLISGYSDIAFTKLPEGLTTKPTLIWDISAAKAGEHAVRVSYQTEGITWWADYNLLYTEGTTSNKGTVDINAWVSILNQSGASYNDAQLKLIAGDVNRAPQAQQVRNSGIAYSKMEAMRGGDEGFAEKSFFEYHLYTLGRATTIPDNSTKQIELFEGAKGVPCEKVLVYDGLGGNFWFDPYNPMTDGGYGVQSSKDVDVYLTFKNNKESHMGMPLPGGRIRVNKVDPADSSVEFIGEDVLKHTPKDEEVLIKMGKSFDVVGERVQTDFKLDTSRKTLDETIEIRLRNRKETSIDVIAQERLFRWANNQIVKSTVEPRKLDARTVHFPVTLKPGEEGKIVYTVRYTW